jgi:hypothetical protein
VRKTEIKCRKEKALILARMDSEKHFAILFLFSRLAEFEKQRIGGDICNKYHYLVSE